MATSIVSLATYKSNNGITSSANDTPLTFFLTAAEAFLRRMCGRDINTGFVAATTYTELLSGCNNETLQLMEWPITSITSVKLVANDGTTTTYSSSAYRCDLDTGLLYRLGARDGRFAGTIEPASDFAVGAEYGGAMDAQWVTRPSWPAGFNNIQVIYVSAGVASADIVYAVMRLTDRMFANKQTNTDLQSEGLGGYSYARRAYDEISKEIDSLIAPFVTGGA